MQKELKDHTCINANQEIEAIESLVLIHVSHRPTSKEAAGCNWQRSAICAKGSRCIYDGSTTYSNLLEMHLSNCAIFNYFTSKYGSNRLTGVCCDCTWCSCTLKYMYFHRRLACKVELSSTLQASRRSMPGIDNCVGEKYLHMPQRCPRYVGGIWEPSFRVHYLV